MAEVKMHATLIYLLESIFTQKIQKKRLQEIIFHVKENIKHVQNYKHICLSVFKLWSATLGPLRSVAEF